MAAKLHQKMQRRDTQRETHRDRQRDGLPANLLPVGKDWSLSTESTSNSQQQSFKRCRCCCWLQLSAY
jgi:hypothetical protein